MTVDLLTPILEDGIEHNHFFEGRLLSGRDLRDEQLANRRNREQLGRAIGAGIVEGLVVTRGADADDGSPVLSVSEGLALNRKGQPIQLHKRVDVRLIRDLGDIPEDAGVFRNCANVLDTLVPSGIGIYILVMSPASAFTESAPKSGLGEDGKVTGCGKRYEVEGVQFRLEKLNPSEVSGVSAETRTEVTSLLTANNAAERSLLRNLVAHMCFGTEAQAGVAVDPLATTGGVSAYASLGALDDLRALGSLSDCDIPLALFYWSLGGLGFLDSWSVRRPTLRPAAASSWPAVLDDRLRSEAEAAMLQFQHHLDELLRSEPNPAAIVGRDYFRHLPSVTMLPLATSTRPRGVSIPVFLAGKTRRGPIFMEGVRLRALISSSFDYPSIDFEAEEMVWMYFIRENRQPANVGGPPPAEPLAVISKGHMPFYGPAQYDISHWDFSNYSSELL